MQTPFPQGQHFYAALVKGRSLQDICIITIAIPQVCPHSPSTSDPEKLLSLNPQLKFLSELWYFCGLFSVKLLAIVQVYSALGSRMHPPSHGSSATLS